MNVVRRLFYWERGPTLRRWAFIETLIIWTTGAILWVRYGNEWFAVYTGIGLFINLAAMFLLWALANKTFHVMAVVGVVDFLGLAPIVFALLKPVDSSVVMLSVWQTMTIGAVVIIAGFAVINFEFFALRLEWGDPMWQKEHREAKEINVTGPEPKILQMMKKGART